MLKMNKETKPTNYFEEARNWFHEQYEAIECSRNRFMVACIVLVILLAMSIATIFFIMPLKQYFYRMVEVNQTSGEVTILKEMENNKAPESWVMNRYFINQYVQARESYSYQDIRRQFNLVIALSDKSISDKYIAETVDTSPSSPIKIYKDQSYREVKVLSINKLNEETAIARFKTFLRSNSELNENKEEDWQVVVKWKYVNEAASFEERDKNPLGFKITYYQLSPMFSEK